MIWTINKVVTGRECDHFGTIVVDDDSVTRIVHVDADGHLVSVSRGSTKLQSSGSRGGETRNEGRVDWWQHVGGCHRRQGRVDSDQHGAVREDLDRRSVFDERRWFLASAVRAGNEREYNVNVAEVGAGDGDCLL